MAGYLESTRGQEGGYTLAKPPAEIIVGEVLSSLGGRLYDDAFCDKHTGYADICSHSVDCSVRSVWQTVQAAVDQVLDRLTLKDLVGQTMPVSVKIPASVAR
jgi:Rrf2 family protein